MRQNKRLHTSTRPGPSGKIQPQAGEIFASILNISNNAHFVSVSSDGFEFFGCGWTGFRCAASGLSCEFGSCFPGPRKAVEVLTLLVQPREKGCDCRLVSFQDRTAFLMQNLQDPQGEQEAVLKAAPPCHVLHYHMVLCSKGTSHNQATAAPSQEPWDNDKADAPSSRASCS